MKKTKSKNLEMPDFTKKLNQKFDMVPYARNA